MIAITPWILVLAATCQDPKPDAQDPATPTPVATTPSSTEPDKAEPSAPNAQQPGAEKTATDNQDASKSDADAPNTGKADPTAPEQPRPDARGWIGLDAVALIINQDITTQGDIEREYFVKYRDKPVTDKGEIGRRQGEILNERVKRVLAMQAGEDLGVSEELIKLQVNDWFDKLTQRVGGVVELTKKLDARHQTPQDLRRDHREELLVRLWEGGITGEGAGGGKRPVRDRYIRPGELKFHYNQVMQDAGNYTALGGTIETLTLQRMLLDPKENGGLDKTIEFANGLRQRILDGDDMSELVRKYGKDKDGMMRDIALPDLKRQFPSMGKFAEKAQVDDVSEPMTLPGKDGTYVQILRLVDKKPAVKPPLVSQEVQEIISKKVQQELDDHRKRQAYEVLFQASYVWPEQRSKQQ